MRHLTTIGVIAVVGVSALAAGTAVAQPTTAPTPTATPAALSASQILQRMAANTTGLTSYEVPVQVAAHVREGAISIPLKMTGERYFKNPDKSALKLHGVPIVAKAFENVYATLGSPVTWPYTYNITLDSIPEVDGRPVYQLRGTYKRPSNVDHIFLDVDAKTFDPVRASWFYRNGASVVLTVQEGIVQGRYRLPQHEEVEADFPGYHGSATIDYGTYRTNIPISNDTFSEPDHS